MNQIDFYAKDRVYCELFMRITRRKCARAGSNMATAKVLPVRALKALNGVPH